MPINDAQYAAVQWLRNSVPGRVLAADLDYRIQELRDKYENNPADEPTRLLLNKYKQSKRLLFEIRLEDLAE